MLRCFTAKYRVCGVQFYPEHLESHGVEGIRIDQIMSELDQIENCLVNQKRLTIEEKKKVCRGTLMTAFSEYLGAVLARVRIILDEFAEKID